MRNMLDPKVCIHQKYSEYAIRVDIAVDTSQKKRPEIGTQNKVNATENYSLQSLTHSLGLVFPKNSM